MTWLSRLLGKKPELPQTATPRPAAVDVSPQPAPPAPAQPDPKPERAPIPSVSPIPSDPTTSDDATVDPDALIDAGDDDAEEADDEADPTIGRYEPLDETTLGDDEVRDLRAQAQGLALSGSHRVGPSDPAGPGSLLEALMRLESEGRVVSRVCDDAESGFYILYEPAPVQG